jgi:hypothetical protein
VCFVCVLIFIVLLVVAAAVAAAAAVIWNIEFYGAESWTLQKVDQNTWEVSECGVGEGWRRSVGPFV